MKGLGLRYNLRSKWGPELAHGGFRVQGLPFHFLDKDRRGVSRWHENSHGSKHGSIERGILGTYFHLYACPGYTMRAAFGAVIWAPVLPNYQRGPGPTLKAPKHTKANPPQGLLKSKALN